jgi:hypothetical protein
VNGIGGQDLFTFVSVAKLQAFWYKIPLVFAVELYFLKKIIFFFKLIFLCCLDCFGILILKIFFFKIYIILIYFQTKNNLNNRYRISGLKDQRLASLALLLMQDVICILQWCV